MESDVIILTMNFYNNYVHMHAHTQLYSTEQRERVELLTVYNYNIYVNEIYMYGFY